jgi:hypothetical protein
MQHPVKWAQSVNLLRGARTAALGSLMSGPVKWSGQIAGLSSPLLLQSEQYLAFARHVEIVCEADLSGIAVL